MARLVEHNHAFHNISQNQNMNEDNNGDPLPALDGRGNEDIYELLLLDLAERVKCLGLQSIKSATRKSCSSY